ncbi:MAG: (2Fe-2S)-binding protein [Myxococcales bacterium]|nr:(2Fe-2S)-binding protein [Myxococcales bacterium]
MPNTISFTLNGKSVRLEVDENRKLLWVLRTELALTGPKPSCARGLCGACTVLVDDRPVRSCMTTVGAVQGQKVVTIEGLAKDGVLHPLQKAFIEHDALQCGFCTPGMILTAYGLLREKPRPSREEVIQGMDRNLCRCGAHTRILDAIQSAAKDMK